LSFTFVSICELSRPMYLTLLPSLNGSNNTHLIKLKYKHVCVQHSLNTL
jgi:hypothetical protein